MEIAKHSVEFTKTKKRGYLKNGNREKTTNLQEQKKTTTR